MELIQNLALGFETSLTLPNLFYCFVGCFVGTLVGVLPGLGPVTTIAMLLPITYGMEPLSALIMLAGIYYGSQYGGSTAAILMNVPGEVSSAITVLDGHQMAKQGRGGVALATAALVSLFAGIVGTLLLAALAVPLARIALLFNSPDYFSLMVLGLVGASAMSSGPLLKSLGMIVIGLLLGVVGIDLGSGVPRLTFGVMELLDGIDFVALAIGIFAFAEIGATLERREGNSVSTASVNRLWPSAEDFRAIFPAMLRGTTIGSLLGPLPGVGPSIASFASYALERKVSATPERFGKGAIEGVAGPEAANNAAAQTSFVPTLTLGIPGSATMALLLAAMIIHNIQPGPRVITSHPELFWGLIVSMFIGNVVLIILNLPFVSIWVKLLNVPYRVLYPAILAICCIGIYAVNSAVFGIYVAAAFGVAGYVFQKLECPPAPLILGFVLGPMLEDNLRRSLVVARGDFSVFLTRPISATFLLVSALLLAFMIVPAIRRGRDAANAE